MPLLNAFRLRDPPRPSLECHVPWWWAFASDPRYQKVSPKKHRTTKTCSRLSELVERNEVPEATVLISGNVNPQAWASQGQFARESGLSTKKPQSHTSKASTIVHIPSPAREGVNQNRTDQRSRSRAKACLRDAKEKIDGTSHAFVEDEDAIYNSEKHTARHLKRGAKRTACQIHSPGRQEHRAKGSDGENLMDPGQVVHLGDLGTPHREAAEEGPVCRCIQKHESKTISPTALSKPLFDMYASKFHHHTNPGLVDHECNQTDSGRSTSTYHTCPERPHTVTRPVLQSGHRTEAGKPPSDDPLSFYLEGPHLYYQARNWSREFSDLTQPSSTETPCHAYFVMKSAAENEHGESQHHAAFCTHHRHKYDQMSHVAPVAFDDYNHCGLIDTSSGQEGHHHPNLQAYRHECVSNCSCLETPLLVQPLNSLNRHDKQFLGPYHQHQSPSQEPCHFHHQQNHHNHERTPSESFVCHSASAGWLCPSHRSLHHIDSIHTPSLSRVRRLSYVRTRETERP